MENFIFCAVLLIKDSQYSQEKTWVGVRCFPVSITKFLRTPISKNISERLLLPLSINIIVDIIKLVKVTFSENVLF